MISNTSIVYWMDIFSRFFAVRIVIFVRKEENNKKRPRMAHFLKNRLIHVHMFTYTMELQWMSFTKLTPSKCQLFESNFVRMKSIALHGLRLHGSGELRRRRLTPPTWSAGVRIPSWGLYLLSCTDGSTLWILELVLKPLILHTTETIGLCQPMLSRHLVFM